MDSKSSVCVSPSVGTSNRSFEKRSKHLGYTHQINKDIQMTLAKTNPAKENHKLTNLNSTEKWKNSTSKKTLVPERIQNRSKIHLPIAVPEAAGKTSSSLDFNANESIIGSTVIEGTGTNSVKEILLNRYEI